MRAKPAYDAHDHDLFRLELVNLIDQRHDLVRLGGLMDWQAFESIRLGSAVHQSYRPTRTAHTAHGRVALPQACLCAERRRTR